MAENRIYTKIALKYNDYMYWTTSDPGTQANKTHADYVPLKGEVCFCEIPAKNGVATTAPTVLFKVGDGTTPFKTLKWASALAADVYNWAKGDRLNLEVTGAGNALTDVEWAEDGLKFTKGETFVTSDEFGQFKNTLKDENTQYQFSIPTTGNDKGKLLVQKKDLEDNDWTTVGAYDFVTPGELTEILEEYKTKQEEYTDPDAADGKYVSKVTQNENGEITVEHKPLPAETELTIVNKAQTDPQDGKTVYAVTNLVEGGDHGHEITPTYTAVATMTAVQAALQEAKAYADDNDANDNTAHGHKDGIGTKVTAAGGVEGEVGVNLNIGIKLETKTENGAENSYLVIYDATSKAEIASLNAAEFVEDSFLQNVEIDDNNILTFTWNIQDTAGKTKTTEINLEGLVDVYTGEETGTIKVTVDGYKIKAELLKQYKEIQAAVANTIPADEIHGLTALSQDENGVISYTSTKITPAAIGAAPAEVLSGYKEKQGEKTYTGSTAKTVTSIKQNENGDITEVTFAEIAFPEAPGAEGTATIASLNAETNVVTLKGAATLDESEGKHTLGNSGTDITLSPVAKTGTIYDLEEANTGIDKDGENVKYFILDCNW